MQITVNSLAVKRTDMLSHGSQRIENEMENENKLFETLAVKLLFKRIGEGGVVLNNERVPHLKKAIESVQFNDGEPNMETVEPRVLSLALMIANEEADQLEAAL